MRLCACQPVLEPYSSLSPSRIAINFTVNEFRQQRSRIFFSPAAPDFSEERLTTFLNFREQIMVRRRLLVACCPNEQIQHDRRQINPCLRQSIALPSSIGFLNLRCDDPGCFEGLEAVRQNVRSNAFPRLLELLKGSK